MAVIAGASAVVARLIFTTAPGSARRPRGSHPPECRALPRARTRAPPPDERPRPPAPRAGRAVEPDRRNRLLAPAGGRPDRRRAPAPARHRPGTAARARRLRFGIPDPDRRARPAATPEFHRPAARR